MVANTRRWVLKEGFGRGWGDIWHTQVTRLSQAEGVVERRHEAEGGIRRQSEPIETTKRNPRSEGAAGGDQNKDVGWDEIMLES